MILVYLLLAYITIRALIRWVTRPTPAPPRIVPRPAYIVYNPMDRALTREAVLAMREARWADEDAQYRRYLEKSRRLHRMNNPELYA